MSGHIHHSLLGSENTGALFVSDQPRPVLPLKVGLSPTSPSAVVLDPIFVPCLDEGYTFLTVFLWFDEKGQDGRNRYFQREICPGIWCGDKFGVVIQ